jgi:uncharacterized membrane protein YcaP (DUF421 family)
MEIINDLLGQGKEFTLVQICVRSALIFLVALVLLRISGRRSFGIHSPLDNTTVILLGAILARGVVGASPLLGVICASAIIVLLHRLFGWLISVNPRFGKAMEGNKLVLYEHGRFITSNMRRAMVSQEEVLLSARTKLRSDNLDEVKRICMEVNGEISIVKK